MMTASSVNGSVPIAFTSSIQNFDMFGATVLKGPAEDCSGSSLFWIVFRVCEPYLPFSCIRNGDGPTIRTRNTNIFTTIVRVNYTVMDVTPNPYSPANQGIFDITKGANKKSCTS